MYSITRTNHLLGPELSTCSFCCLHMLKTQKSHGELGESQGSHAEIGAVSTGRHQSTHQHTEMQHEHVQKICFFMALTALNKHSSSGERVLLRIC